MEALISLRLGLKLDVEAEVVQKAIETEGIGFIYAPKFHPSIRHISGLCREIAVRTVFNILDPLTNPVNVKVHLLGVSEVKLINLVAQVLKGLGYEETMVVHRLDRLDEVSMIDETLVAWFKDEEIKLLKIAPRDFNLEKAKPESLVVRDLDESVEVAFKLLYCDPDLKDPKVRMLLANSSAALVLSGKADNFANGVEIAMESIASGSAYKKLKNLIKAYGSSTSTLEEMKSRYERLSR